jgi:hypothetical protein
MVVLIDPNALSTQLDGITAQTFLDDFEQGGVQVGAVHRVVGPAVALVDPGRFLMDQLTELVEPEELFRFDGTPAKTRLDPQVGQTADRVREQVEADAQRLEFGRGFEDPAGDPGTLQVERSSETGDASADYRDMHGMVLLRLMVILIGSAVRTLHCGTGPLVSAGNHVCSV